MSEGKQRDLVDMLADGEYTPYEAAGQLALAQSMQKQLKTQIDALKEYLTGQLDADQHLTTSLGTVTAKRGSEPRWRVKDPVAFAQWLDSHGEGTSVERVPYPVEWATKPDAIEHLIGQHGGEQPDGVELSRGTGDTVAVSRVKDWADVARDLPAAGQARRLLGIDAVQPPSGDGEDEETRWESGDGKTGESAWDRI